MENYYYIETKMDQTYPLLCIIERDDAINPTLINLEFNDPIPRNPVMADFLSGAEIFITNKIVEVVKNFNIPKVRFINTELTTPKGNLIEDYFCLKTEYRYHVLDKENSEFEYEFFVYSISKFILARKVLNDIPLEERLIFVVRESPSIILFHESIAKAIMEVNPTGMVFKNIEAEGEILE